MPRYTSGPTSEVLRLQEEITREVNKDAEHLATSVFGARGSQPDIKRVDDDMIETAYRKAYESGNRKWLVSEAQRDPEQFVNVSRKIGVTLPDEQAPPAMPPAAAPLPMAGPITPQLSQTQPLPTAAAPGPTLPPPGPVVPPPSTMPPLL
jgi:hypothetical protein